MKNAGKNYNQIADSQKKKLERDVIQNRFAYNFET